MAADAAKIGVAVANDRSTDALSLATRGVEVTVPWRRGERLDAVESRVDAQPVRRLVACYRERTEVSVPLDDDGTISPTITASLVYDDARQGIRWLVDVLGFRVATSYEMPNGGVAFAELVWRTGVVFVSGRPPSGSPWSKVGPASIALAAEHAQAVDALYERAMAAGAEIVRPVHDARTPAFPDGSHQFDLRDPGGNLWTVGTFRSRISDAG